MAVQTHDERAKSEVRFTRRRDLERTSDSRGRSNNVIPVWFWFTGQPGGAIRKARGGLAQHHTAGDSHALV